MADEERKQILHQLGAKLQEAENQNPIKLHQLGAEIVSADKISSIIESNGMLPIFGIIPWKHHLVITSKCKSINEAFYYITRTIDEGLSKRELEDIIDANDFNKYGHAITKNPMGVATYEGIKIKDKLPSVEDLRKRLDMVEKELREYKENEASEKEGTNTSNLTKP